MGSPIMWYSKDDVLNDLPNTGHRVTDLDESCFVKGQRPPPSRFLDEDDDEVRLRYGLFACNGEGGNSDVVAPDVDGIKQMLQAVKANEEPEEPENESVVVISKLNPEVKEFFPTSKQTKDTPAPGQDRPSGDAPVTDVESENLTLTNSKLEKQKLEKKLKEQICNSKKDCPLEKRNRNVAMAALLKLNTVPTPPSIVLNTPEFYESLPKASTSKVDKGIEEKGDTIPEAKPALIDVSNVKSPDPEELLDPQTKQNVAKVDTWLDRCDGKPSEEVAVTSPVPKPKPKQLPCILEPVTFKKKESRSPNKPPSVSSGSTTLSNRTKTQAYKTKDYVPSESYKEIERQMLANVKAVEDKRKKDIYADPWNNLDLILKEKDKEKLKQKRQVTILS